MALRGVVSFGYVQSILSAVKEVLKYYLRTMKKILLRLIGKKPEETEDYDATAER